MGQSLLSAALSLFSITAPCPIFFYWAAFFSAATTALDFLLSSEHQPVFSLHTHHLQPPNQGWNCQQGKWPSSSSSAIQYLPDKLLLPALAKRLIPETSGEKVLLVALVVRSSIGPDVATFAEAGLQDSFSCKSCKISMNLTSCLENSPFCKILANLVSHFYLGNSTKHRAAANIFSWMALLKQYLLFNEW